MRTCRSLDIVAAVFNLLGPRPQYLAAGRVLSTKGWLTNDRCRSRAFQGLNSLAWGQSHGFVGFGPSTMYHELVVYLKSLSRQIPVPKCTEPYNFRGSSQIADTRHASFVWRLDRRL
jgi:hypothetical protein